MSSGSQIARFGIMRRDEAEFSPVLERDERRAAHLASCPAVVGTAMIGGHSRSDPVRARRGSPLLRKRRPMRARSATAFARSIGDPPPIATMESQPRSRNIATPSSAAASVGFSGVRSKTGIPFSRPPDSITRSTIPASTTPRSATMSGALTPSAFNSSPMSLVAPASNWMRVR